MERPSSRGAPSPADRPRSPPQPRPNVGGRANSPEWGCPAAIRSLSWAVGLLGRRRDRACWVLLGATCSGRNRAHSRASAAALLSRPQARVGRDRTYRTLPAAVTTFPGNGQLSERRLAVPSPPASMPCRGINAVSASWRRHTLLAASPSRERSRLGGRSNEFSCAAAFPVGDGFGQAVGSGRWQRLTRRGYGPFNTATGPLPASTGPAVAVASRVKTSRSMCATR